MNRYSHLSALCGMLLLADVASAQYRYDYQRDRDGAAAQTMVQGWYRQFLDRELDAGARGWMKALRQGQSPQQVLAQILASEEYYQKAGGTPQRFVRQLYRDTNGKTPRDGQFWNLVEQAEHGDRAEVAGELLGYHPGPWNRSRPDSHAEEKLVRQWYKQYVGREPERAALHHSVDQLERGTAPIHVLAEIFASPEYYQRAGGTPEAFVRGVFRDLAGIVPDRNTITYWAARAGSHEQRQTLANSTLQAHKGWPTE